MRMKSSYELFGVECGAGWGRLIEPLMQRCAAEGVTILQIKEKFGGLRFYVGKSSASLREMIDQAENASYSICEDCGAPGRLRGGSWLRTLCDVHAEGRERYVTRTF